MIVGIGRVTSVGEATEYAYQNRPANALRSMVWERNLKHSIAPGIGDGFLLPYPELLALAEADPELDLARLVLHAPEEHWDAFSMGAEHVSHDQAVAVLLSAASVVGRSRRSCLATGGRRDAGSMESLIVFGGCGAPFQGWDRRCRR